MRLGSRMFLSAAMVAAIGGIARADVKKRWELDFTHQRPEHFTFRSPLGKETNYIYMVYTVTNNTPQVCPLIVDVALLVDGREWQQPGFYPVEEEQVIADADNLRGYSVGIQKELIQDFKKRHKYLNKSDMRAIGTLAPGETVHCLAIFRDMAFRYNTVEVMVSGLVDPVTYKWAHDPGKSTADSKIYLRYENRVFRLTYERTGDQFYSFERGWTLTKHDWIAVGVNPAVTKDDVAELVKGLTNDDPLIRRVAQDVLIRYTAAARKDMDLDKLLSNNPKDKVEALTNAKAILEALAKMKDWQGKRPVFFSSMKDRLIALIPPIDDEVASLKVGAALNDDQIKTLTEKVKIIVTKAKENKCPLPTYIEAALTREAPTSQNVYDWICGYTDPATKILYPGIQQWKEFISDLCDQATEQQKNFDFVKSLFDSLDDPTWTDADMRDLAISVLKDVATDERMTVDVSAFDPKKSWADQNVEVKDAILRWREWWSRNRDDSAWNPSTKSFEPKK